MPDALTLTCGMFAFDDPGLAPRRDTGRVAVAPPVFKELSDEWLVTDLEDAMGMKVDALAAQVFVGASTRRRRCTVWHLWSTRATVPAWRSQRWSSTTPSWRRSP